MLKKIILTTAMAAGIAGTNAQSVTYRTESDDPKSYKSTAVDIDLFTADTYLNPNIGYGAKFETVLKGRLMVGAGFRYSYLDANTHHVVSGFPTNSGGLKKQLITDIGGSLFLVNKSKTKNLKVVLSSMSFGGYTHTRYMMVPGTMTRMLGVRGGIYYNRRAIEFEGDSHKLYNYKSPSGQEVAIGDVGSGGTDQPAGESYKPLSMSNIVSLYGGVHLRKVTNLFIVTGGSTKSNAKVVDLYADLMLAPVVPIADVVDINGAKWGIVAKSGSIRHLGWRAGVVSRGTRTASFEYNFEFGQKPGPKMGTGFLNNGTYISMGVGIAIAFKKLI